ncbi:hypothetical protein VX159_14135 [Dechloromonas sp. ZY10]|uniref:hypothetical protein n=1 Tax=Dechloromonas aquae TaxID=2664436 RepID=UPI0035280E0D
MNVAVTRCLLSLLCALPLACGEPDQRAFAIENAVFASWYQRQIPAASVPSETARARVADGLAAICRGRTDGAAELLREAGVGKDIYRLALVAAKADRKGRCDYSDWSERLGLHGERIKQLVNQGDGPAVLLAALLDEQLPEGERLRVVEALAERRYGQAQAVLAVLRGPADPMQTELLMQARAQGVALAYLVAIGQSAGAGCSDWQQAQRLVPGLSLPHGLSCPAAVRRD